MTKRYNFVTRALAALALLFVYVVGTSAILVGATTSSAQAWVARGGGRGGGWGRGGGRGKGGRSYTSCHGVKGSSFRTSVATAAALAARWCCTRRIISPASCCKG